MQVIRSNGVNIHAKRETTGGGAAGGAGSGPTLVLVNSLGTDLRLWDDVVAALPAGLDVLRSDKRGHGLSDAPEPPYAMTDLADDLAGLLDALGIGRAMVCGISVGGMIAMSLALRRPDLVQGLAIMDSGHRIGTADHWNQRIAAVEAEGLAGLADTIVQGWLSDAFRAERPGETAAWRNMVARTPAPAGYAGTCAALRDCDLSEAVGGIAVPTLCLCGDRDASTPPELMRELSGLIPGARYAEIAGTRHLPCIERPEEVARHLAGLIAGRSDRGEHA